MPNITGHLIVTVSPHPSLYITPQDRLHFYNTKPRLLRLIHVSQAKVMAIIKATKNKTPQGTKKNDLVINPAEKRVSAG